MCSTPARSPRRSGRGRTADLAGAGRPQLRCSARQSGSRRTSRTTARAAESLAIAARSSPKRWWRWATSSRRSTALGGGNPASALAVVGPVLQQIDRLSHLQADSRYPSAFSIGKMLLMLSGDAQANPPANHEADKLAALLGAVSAADVANAQAALGIVSLLIGSMIDRSFTAPSADAAAGLVTQALPELCGQADADARRSRRAWRQRWRSIPRRPARSRPRSTWPSINRSRSTAPASTLGLYGERGHRRAGAGRAARPVRGQRRLHARPRSEAQQGRRADHRQRRARRHAVDRRARHVAAA